MWLGWRDTRVALSYIPGLQVRLMAVRALLLPKNENKHPKTHRAMCAPAGDRTSREAVREKVTQPKQTVRVRRKRNIKGKRQ